MNFEPWVYTVKVITGDNFSIAQHISQEIGLNGHITHGLNLYKMIKEDPRQATTIVEQTDGFAEIYPQDKFEICTNPAKCGTYRGNDGRWC